MGSELAAYRGDAFVRLVEIAPALLDPRSLPRSPAAGEPARPSWGRSLSASRGPRWWGYRWGGNGHEFAPAADVAELSDEVVRYLESTPARTTFIDHIRPADLERLEALGYW